jgi:hypothetical protein
MSTGLVLPPAFVPQRDGAPDVRRRLAAQASSAAPHSAFGITSPYHSPSDDRNIADPVLRQQGIVADPVHLRRLPHDVVLSDRLLGRVGHGPGDTVHR